MKNIYITGIKRNLVPRVIVNGYQIYLAFVHETSKRPLRYYDFLPNGNLTEDVAPYESGDYVCKLTPSSYFELNDRLMNHSRKYNLKQKMHAYNKKKYSKISTKNHTV